MIGDIKKIGITGTMKTGKSYLGHEILSYLSRAKITGSVAHRSPFGLEESSNFMGQHWIMFNRIAQEIEMGETVGTRTLICPRTVAGDYAYLQYLDSEKKEDPDDANSVIVGGRIANKERYEHMYNFATQTAISWMKTYDILFYLPPQNITDFSQLGISKTFAKKIDNNILSLLKDAKVDYIELDRNQIEDSKVWTMDFLIERGII